MLPTGPNSPHLHPMRASNLLLSLLLCMDKQSHMGISYLFSLFLNACKQSIFINLLLITSTILFYCLYAGFSFMGHHSHVF